MGHATDRGQTTGAPLRFPVRDLVVRFHLRVVPILGWLAAFIRILGVALQCVARAAASDHRARCGLLADGAATHHH